MNEQERKILEYAKTTDFIIPVECARVLEVNFEEEFRTIIKLLFKLVEDGFMRVRDCEGLAFEIK
jgi:hypothetical protein